jgi:hypothetical protein
LLGRSRSERKAVNKRYRANAAFATLADRGAGAIMIGQDTFFTSQPAQLAALAKRYAMP